MNAYFIDGGEDSDATGFVRRDVDVVVAPTRGRAKSLFCAHYPEIEYTSIERCRLIAHHVSGRAEGIVDSQDSLWAEADRRDL